ncbi:MAG: monovalent cation/H(+) antiporter subunit G [Pseudolabrys sp.]
MAVTIGLLRFPDTLTRLHALTKVDNLGLGLIVFGLLPLCVAWVPRWKVSTNICDNGRWPAPCLPCWRSLSM